MQVCPEDATIDLPDGLEEMVVVIPINGEKDEAESVAEEGRDKGTEGGEGGFFRDK